ncbi:hypothetical protein TSOC_013668, partial [Tetrabaena socialis]
MTTPALRGQPALGRCGRCLATGAPPQPAHGVRRPVRSARHAAVAAAWGSPSLGSDGPASAAATTGPRDADLRGVRVDGSSSTAASEVARSHERGAPAPLKWSWQEDLDSGPELELDPRGVEVAASVPELTALLASATANAPPRAALTPAAHALLDAAAQRLLSYDHPAAAAAASSSPRCSLGEAAQLLQAYGRVALGPAAGVAAGTPDSSSAGASVAAPLVAAVMSHVCGADGGGPGAGGSVLESASARELADLLWAVSELQEDLPWEEREAGESPGGAGPLAGPGGAAASAASAAPAALQRAVLARIREQDFLAPDLCRAVCALGVLAPVAATSGAAAALAGSAGSGFQLGSELLGALNEEVRYQLTEFDADFEAADLGRLILGMGRLRLGAAVLADGEYR